MPSPEAFGKSEITGFHHRMYKYVHVCDNNIFIFVWNRGTHAFESLGIMHLLIITRILKNKQEFLRFRRKIFWPAILSREVLQSYREAVWVKNVSQALHSPRGIVMGSRGLFPVPWWFWMLLWGHEVPLAEAFTETLDKLHYFPTNCAQL